MSNQLLEALGMVIALSDGLAEKTDDSTLDAVLPSKVARLFDVPELVTFSTQADNRNSQFISYNSPLFSQCSSLLGDQGTLGSMAVRYPGYIKQSGFEKLILSTIVPQNGLIKVGEAKLAWTPYCQFNFTYTAEGIEKRLGLVSLWINGVTGVVDVEIGDALLWDSDRISIPEEIDLDVERIFQVALDVGQTRIQEQLAPWLSSLQRKLDRDENRIKEYYWTIIGEIERKCQKKGLEGEALARELGRIEATELELKRKLADLSERYCLNVTALLDSIFVVWLETVVIECQLLRKKNKRNISVVYNPYTHLIEPICCETTKKPTTRFLLNEQMKIVSV